MRIFVVIVAIGAFSCATPEHVENRIVEKTLNIHLLGDRYEVTETTYEVDSAGRTVGVVRSNELGEKTSHTTFLYNAQGKKSEVTRHSQSSQSKTIYVYENNRLVRGETYDEFENLQSFTRYQNIGDSLQSQKQYDRKGQLRFWWRQEEDSQGKWDKTNFYYPGRPYERYWHFASTDRKNFSSIRDDGEEVETCQSLSITPGKWETACAVKTANDNKTETKQTTLLGDAYKSTRRNQNGEIVSQQFREFTETTETYSRFDETGSLSFKLVTYYR